MNTITDEQKTIYVNEAGHRIWLLCMDLLETYEMIMTRYLEHLDDRRQTKKF